MPNGLELSCLAEAGNSPLLYGTPAGQASSNQCPARRVSFSELLGAQSVHSQDIGDTLFSRHRLQSVGQVHLAPTDPYPRDDIVNLVGSQLVSPDLVVAEVQVVDPVVHLL
jgi:hypothetical protein